MRGSVFVDQPGLRGSGFCAQARQGAAIKRSCQTGAPQDFAKLTTPVCADRWLRTYEHGKEVAVQRRATFPVVPVRTEPAGPGGEAERRLGPFSIGGKNYTVVLRQKPRARGSTQETGDTVVAMEIRDSDKAVLYKRAFPSQSENDVDSGAWSVSAHVLTRSGGTGLLVSYSVDAEPSAPTAEETAWWQLLVS